MTDGPDWPYGDRVALAHTGGGGIAMVEAQQGMSREKAISLLRPDLFEVDKDTVYGKTVCRLHPIKIELGRLSADGSFNINYGLGMQLHLAASLAENCKANGLKYNPPERHTIEAESGMADEYRDMANRLEALTQQ